jgi:hypothetical protein
MTTTVGHAIDETSEAIKDSVFTLSLPTRGACTRLNCCYPLTNGREPREWRDSDPSVTPSCHALRIMHNLAAMLHVYGSRRDRGRSSVRVPGRGGNSIKPAA